MKIHRFVRAILLVASILATSGSLAGETPDSEMDIADRDTYLAEITALLKVKWPQNRTITIVCHGHSVPAGYFRTPVVDTFNAYPQLLHRQLKERFPHAVINVIVTAIGGETSPRGAARFKDVLRHNPDILLLDYSLNDRRIGLEPAHAAWSAMIDQAKTTGAKVILLTPTADTGANLEDPSDPLHQHAEQIRHLAREHHVAVADSLVAFQTYPGDLNELMSQPNHPNRHGHELVLKELLKWFP